MKQSFFLKLQSKSAIFPTQFALFTRIHWSPFHHTLPNFITPFSQALLLPPDTLLLKFIKIFCISYASFYMSAEYGQTIISCWRCVFIWHHKGSTHACCRAEINLKHSSSVWQPGALTHTVMGLASSNQIPKDHARRQQWIKQVQRTRSQWKRPSDSELQWSLQWKLLRARHSDSIKSWPR